MATHTITGSFTHTYQIKTSGDDWTFTKAFSADGETFGIHISSQYDNNTILINGQVHGSEAGLYSEADGTSISLGATAKVTGSYGLALSGDNITIVNDGKIVGKNYGLNSEPADHLTFTNESLIKSDQAVYVGVNSKVINAADAVISGNFVGVDFADDIGTQSRLVNHGTITATQYAVAGNQGDLTVINDGTIRGIITLGPNNARFDNRGGIIVNDDNGVRGGFGQDTLITDSAKVKLIEEADQGIHDTVRSTVSYRLSANVEDLFLIGSKGTNAIGTNLENVLHGNSGDNVIKGLLGLDELYGHKGTDILIGGGGGDIFHFSTGDGHDTVTDFENGLDKVDLSGWKAISSFDDLMQHHIEFANGDAIIAAGKDSLTLKGVAEADLDAGDFVFAM